MTYNQKERLINSSSPVQKHKISTVYTHLVAPPSTYYTLAAIDYNQLLPERTRRANPDLVRKIPVPIEKLKQLAQQPCPSPDLFSTDDSDLLCD